MGVRDAAEGLACGWNAVWHCAKNSLDPTKDVRSGLQDNGRVRGRSRFRVDRQHYGSAASIGRGTLQVWHPVLRGKRRLRAPVPTGAGATRTATAGCPLALRDARTTTRSQDDWGYRLCARALCPMDLADARRGRRSPCVAIDWNGSRTYRPRDPPFLKDVRQYFGTRNAISRKNYVAQRSGGRAQPLALARGTCRVQQAEREFMHAPPWADVRQRLPAGYPAPSMNQPIMWTGRGRNHPAGRHFFKR